MSADKPMTDAKTPPAVTLTPAELWKATEQRVRDMERKTAADDSHRRIVRVALRHPPADPLYLGEMASAPIVASDDIDQVQWSDGSWEPVPAAEETA